jgi:hypothetical protein
VSAGGFNKDFSEPPRRQVRQGNPSVSRLGNLLLAFFPMKLGGLGVLEFQPNLY